MKTRLCIVIGAAVLMLDLAAGDFVLVRNRQPKCSIVLPEMEKKNGKVAAAAGHFNEDLKTIAGTALPVVRKDAAGNRITFVIRKTDSLATADHYTIRFPDPRTLTIEATEESVQWAFNHILREYAGAEWILPENCGLSYTPLKDLVIPAKTIEVKNISWPLGRTLSVHNMWWMQNLRNGTKYFSHTLTDYAFPPSKYGKDNSWPKAIMPVLNGKKITALPDPKEPRVYWQPCYSNPETAKIAVENLLEYLKKYPETLAVGLTVNDNRGYCECRECLKIDRKAKRGRSETYYMFINRVANEICKKYPKLLIVVGAYDLTYQPPSFKLHPNAIVRLTIDFNSCVDPKMHEKHQRIIAEWGKKASMIGLWDYSWGYPYPMPRLYFSYHFDMLKFMHEHNGRFYDAECWTNDAYEGPKHYLISRFLWDSKQDLKKLEEEWYVRCVGKKAAPYLRAYYKIWNDYFTGPVTKTPWFQSAGNVYMTYPDHSCVYALTEEDLRKAGEAMDQVVKLAGTAQEKERAALMMRHWRLTFLRLSLLGAGIYDHQGMIHTPRQALKLLDTVSKAQAFQEEYDRLCKILLKEKYLRQYYLSRYYQINGGTPVGMNYASRVRSHIIAAAAFARNPEVAEKLKMLASDPNQPAAIRQVSQVMLDPDIRQNLIPGGNAENGVPAMFTVTPQGAELSTSDQYKAEGKKSFLISVKRNALLFSVACKAKPMTTYLITFKAFIPNPSAEGYLVASFWRQRNGMNQEYNKPPRQKLSGGVWQSFALMTFTKENSDGVRLRVYMNNFEKGDKIYVDDVRLIEVGPASTSGQPKKTVKSAAFGTPADFQKPEAFTQEGNVLRVKGSGEFRSAKTLTLDAAKNYRFSAEFRMKSGTPAKILSGFIPLDENGKAIHPTAVKPVPDTETEVAAEAYRGEKILRVKDASRWKDKNAYGFIALIVKDDFSDLPNRNILPIAKDGIKQNGNIWEISLKAPLTKTVDAGTKVRQHSDGATYIWTGGLAQPKDKWLKKSGNLSGEIAKNGNPQNQLWPGTKKIRLVIRINGKDDSVTEIRNVKLEEVIPNQQ